MKKAFHKKSVLIVFIVVVSSFLGLFAFQRGTDDITINGYLDPAQRIKYAGGTVPGSDNIYFVELLWHSSPTTKDAIDYYVQASHDVGQELLDSGVNKFYLGVTLRDYIPAEEFEGFVSQLDVDVKEFGLRATFPDDPKDRYTVSGRPVGEHIIDPERLQSFAEGLKSQARVKKADKIAVERTNDPETSWADVLEPEEFKSISVPDDAVVINGVYTFEAVTDADGYRRLLADPHVYHIDVTATLVYQQLKDQGVKWADFIQVPNLGDYDPFWAMETIGLDKFR